MWHLPDGLYYDLLLVFRSRGVCLKLDPIIPLRDVGASLSLSSHATVFDIAPQAFTIILCIITVASYGQFSKLVSAHLTVVLLTLLAVYAYRDVWPLLTFIEEPVDSCEGYFLWGKLASLTVGAVVYPLFSPRLYIPLDDKVCFPCACKPSAFDLLF